MTDTKAVFAAILAGGIGTRMGNIEKPKQFMEVAGKPIIIHTIEKFVIHPEFRSVLVLTPKQWIKHTQDLVRKYIPDGLSVTILEGGADRNETLMNAIRHVETEFGLTEDTVIVTHDSVRPFVSHRIIEENIRAGLTHDACDTVVPATDTIVESADGTIIRSIPDRSQMFQGQTPQTFRAKLLKETYESLTEEEKSILTDACKIMVMKGHDVHMVTGEVSNIKITYPYDIRIAEVLLGGNQNG